MTETKKISLNFKQLADAAVREIASATFGDDGEMDLKSFLVQHLHRMDKEKFNLAEMVQVGGRYADQVRCSLQSLHDALGDLERARPPSLMGKLLGRGVTTPGMIDAVTKMMMSCDRALIDLRDTADSMLKQMQERRSVDEMLDKQAQGLGDLDGLKIIQHIAHYRESFADTAKTVEKLVDVSRDFEKAGVQAHERVDKLLKKQKSWLSGTRVSP